MIELRRGLVVYVGFAFGEVASEDAVVALFFQGFEDVVRATKPATPRAVHSEVVLGRTLSWEPAQRVRDWERKGYQGKRIAHTRFSCSLDFFTV